MYVSLLFWLALLFPGYVLIRRFWPEESRAGLFGVIALSYLATFALLSPIAILGYVVGYPLWVLSGACVIAILVALCELTRRRWWREMLALVLAALSIELVVVSLDLILGALDGTFLSGDAWFHQARIRFLLDNGMSNRDPFVAGDYFYPIYHTNILHALCAAGTQLTGIDHFGFWYAGLAWAKLVAASGAYYLVWVVYERQWPAWAAAVFTVGAWGPANFMLYPNKLAPLWILPCLLAFVIQACHADVRWRQSLKIGGASLVLAQIHGLYSGVAILAAAPVMAVFILVRGVRRKAAWPRLVLCTLALTVALPFVYVSRASSRYATQVTAPSEVSAERKPASFLIECESGSVFLDPRMALGPNSVAVFGLLTAGAVISLFTSRRSHVCVALGFVVAISMVLFVPPLCERLYGIVREAWIVRRCTVPLRMAVLIFVPGTAAYVLSRWSARWWMRLGLTLVLVVGGALCFGRSGVGAIDGDVPAAATWPDYLRRTTALAEGSDGGLTLVRETSSFLREHIPRGATVLTEMLSVAMVTMHDCYVIAPERGSTGVMDMKQRRADLRAMKAPRTPWPRRSALLRRYGITHAVAGALESPMMRWAGPHIKDYAVSDRGLVVIELDASE